MAYNEIILIWVHTHTKKPFKKYTISDKSPCWTSHRIYFTHRHWIKGYCGPWGIFSLTFCLSVSEWQSHPGQTSLHFLFKGRNDTKCWQVWMCSLYIAACKLMLSPHCVRKKIKNSLNIYNKEINVRSISWNTLQKVAQYTLTWKDKQNEYFWNEKYGITCVSKILSIMCE